MVSGRPAGAVDNPRPPQMMRVVIGSGRAGDSIDAGSDVSVSTQFSDSTTTSAVELGALVAKRAKALYDAAAFLLCEHTERLSSR